MVQQRARNKVLGSMTGSVGTFSTPVYFDGS